MSTIRLLNPPSLPPSLSLQATARALSLAPASSLSSPDRSRWMPRESWSVRVTFTPRPCKCFATCARPSTPSGSPPVR